MPDTIVTALREVPGTKASTCVSPMISPSRNRTFSNPTRPATPRRAFQE